MAEASRNIKSEPVDDVDDIALPPTEQEKQPEHRENGLVDDQKSNIGLNCTMAITNNTITSEDDFMDYDSDDDDDDSKSNHSSSNQNLNPNFVNASGKQSGKNKGQSHKDEDRRAHHNVLERRRRDHLKDSFTQLRASVPTFRRDRASRTEILVQAAEFIIARVQKNATMQQELDALVRENRQLEEANKN